MTEIKPIAHLVWRQYLRAADDVEDYFEVAGPNDKSVDGSDPFPVYDDRALAAKDSEIERLHNHAGDEALRLVVTYDDLLRTFNGPVESITDSDHAKIDKAYDEMVDAARAAMGGQCEPTRQQVGRAIEAYREGTYLTNGEVFASVSAIVRAALNPERAK